MDDLQQLEQQAIDAAINTNWPQAIEFNRRIIKLSKYDVDSYLRLAFAYLQTAQTKEAKKFYKKALKLQPSNQAILSNLERIKVLESKKEKTTQKKVFTLDPNLFLETPGKTKSITLVNPGQKNILAALTIGQEVILLPKKRKIEIRTKTKEYIGSLPDDISKRLTIFIKAGSQFAAYVKESSLTKVVIFMREEKKGKKVAKYSSFPNNIQFRLTEISQEEESEKEHEEDLSENDLDKLAEVLATEEKDYLPYGGVEEEEEPEE